MGFRKGDGADMAMIELVDFNELMLEAKKPTAKTTRRRKRKSSGKDEQIPVAPVAPQVVDEAPGKEEE